MPLLAGRYELGEELGRGGMARVVAAHDTVLDRPVAVKLLTTGDDPVARARFLQEGRTAARVRHPAAVAVHDTGEVDGQPFLVMERIHGTTLSERLRESGPLAIDEAVAITTGVLDALDAAHRAGMVHRDIKPANVFLPDEGGVKLGDFGIAKALDDTSSSLTATGAVMGTPTYLAPELVEGQPASPASDLYGVGCLLYAQLAGRPPFNEGGPVAVAYAHRHQPVPPIESKRPDVPRALCEVVMRALAKDPGARYPDAARMRAALLGQPEGGAGAAAGTAGPGGTRTVALDGGAALEGTAQQRTAPVRRPAEQDDDEADGSRRAGPWTLLLVLVLLLAAWWAAGQPGLDALRNDTAPLEEQDEPVDADDDPPPDPPPEEPGERDGEVDEEPPADPDPPADDDPPAEDDPPPDEPDDGDEGLLDELNVDAPVGGGPDGGDPDGGGPDRHDPGPDDTLADGREDAAGAT